MSDLPHTSDRKATVVEDPAQTRASAGRPVESPVPGEGLAPGSVVGGKYKLLEPVGEGGMGAVWMAQQIEPVKRLVAVKFIKSGADSRTVVARFEAERLAL